MTPENDSKPAVGQSASNAGLGDAVDTVEMLGKLAHALMHANEKSVCGAAPNGRYFGVLSEYENLRERITGSPNV